jgi:hypothetical protein
LQRGARPQAVGAAGVDLGEVSEQQRSDLIGAGDDRFQAFEQSVVVERSDGGTIEHAPILHPEISSPQVPDGDAFDAGLAFLIDDAAMGRSRGHLAPATARRS